VGYLNKLWTDFDEIYGSIAAGSARFGYVLSRSKSGSWIRTCIQNCNSDSAKSNGRFSM